jgi:protein TonB
MDIHNQRGTVMVKRMMMSILTLVVFCCLSSVLIASAEQKQKKTSPAIDDTVNVDEFPSPTKQVPPKYPEDAKKQGIQGKVYLKVLIGTDGVPKDARVIKSDAVQLDSAALKSCMQWRFKPATYKGEPVEIWVVIPFNFVLDKDKPKDKPKAK